MKTIGEENSLHTKKAPRKICWQAPPAGSVSINPESSKLNPDCRPCVEMVQARCLARPDASGQEVENLQVPALRCQVCEKTVPWWPCRKISQGTII